MYKKENHIFLRGEIVGSSRYDNEVYVLVNTGDSDIEISRRMLTLSVNQIRMATQDKDGIDVLCPDGQMAEGQSCFIRARIIDVSENDVTVAFPLARGVFGQNMFVPKNAIPSPEDIEMTLQEERIVVNVSLTAVDLAEIMEGITGREPGFDEVRKMEREILPGFLAEEIRDYMVERTKDVVKETPSMMRMREEPQP